VESQYQGAYYGFRDCQAIAARRVSRTVRDDIAEMMQLLTEASKSRLAERVDPIDERFLRATREVPLPVSYPSAEPRDRWWYRIPKRLGEDLASDLCSIGLIECSD